MTTVSQTNKRNQIFNELVILRQQNLQLLSMIRQNHVFPIMNRLTRNMKGVVLLQLSEFFASTQSLNVENLEGAYASISCLETILGAGGVAGNSVDLLEKVAKLAENTNNMIEMAKNA